jgi:Uma2 family endonuclease
MEITDFNQLDLNKLYSYADYLTWGFNERIELLKGKIFKMSPAPASNHQRISWKISFALGKHLEHKNCSIFYAPFDVRLERQQDEKKIQTVVQPDICVICDETKIDEKGCLGAPNLVVEILSSGNSDKEMKYKFELYEEAGVEEYWLVNPSEKTILQYVLTKNQFISKRPLILEDTIKSAILTGFEMPLNEVFK